MDNRDLVLDATKIFPHSVKHQVIFERFESLKDLEFFILHNDHDPIPLFYQFQNLFGKTFDWEYLEKGPQVWEVKITRHVKAATEYTIGQIVADDYRRSDIFLSFGIDFNQQGKETLEVACLNAGANFDEVVKALQVLDNQGGQKQSSFNIWQLDFLSNHIITVHHSYVRESIPEISGLITDALNSDGAAHPELAKIEDSFKKVSAEMLAHMEAEEKYLFPYVAKLLNAEKTHQKLPAPKFGSIENPIQHHLEEHDSAGNHLKDINKLTNGYQAPSGAGEVVSKLYEKLSDFEKDLYLHIHLENNILFGKSIELEKKVIEA